MWGMLDGIFYRFDDLDLENILEFLHFDKHQYTQNFKLELSPICIDNTVKSFNGIVGSFENTAGMK